MCICVCIYICIYIYSYVRFCANKAQQCFSEWSRCSSSPYACIMCMHADYACMHEYMHACVICMHAYHACTHIMHACKLCMHAYDAYSSKRSGAKIEDSERPQGAAPEGSASLHWGTHGAPQCPSDSCSASLNHGRLLRNCLKGCSMASAPQYPSWPQ